MNPYDLLEIHPGASLEEIRVAYHRLAKAWHPNGLTGAARERAGERFFQLAKAFNDLMASGSKARADGVPGDGARQHVEALEKDSCPFSRSPEDWFREAQEALEFGDRKLALGLLQVALREDSRNAQYHLLHAQLLMENASNLRQAVKALETALTFQPVNAEAMIKLARLYRTLGMPARASGLLKKAQAIAPNHKFFRLQTKRTPASSAPPVGFGDQMKVLVQRFLKWG